MAENNVAAVVLAGGASSRMGRPKGLMPFLGQPLAARVAARLARQAGAVYLNAEGRDYAALGLPLVADPPRWRGAGPLAGVAAALERAVADGFGFLVTAPCDAPFPPLDLVARLSESGGAAVAVSSFGLEPMFAIWPVSALGAVEAALASGRSSPRSVLETLGAARASFADADFVNCNTPQEFADAEARAKMLEAADPGLGPL